MSSSQLVEKYEEPDFRWLQRRGVGGKRKDVKFYESFLYDGVIYNLYDCVYMHKQGEPPYIGKLVKIWENADASKKVKVQWFFRPMEISFYLKDVEVLENELFLASGEGSGLSNINPLEAIAGRCNVVCISVDIRNPQPDAEELQVANYVFYRTFDVKTLTISEQMNDIVGGLQVKFVFNRKETDRMIEATDCRKKTMLAEITDQKRVQGKKGIVLGDTKAVSLSVEASSVQNISSVHVNSGKDKEAFISNDQVKVLGSKNNVCKVIGEIKDVKSPVIDVRVEARTKSARRSTDLDDKSIKRVKNDETVTSVKDKGTHCAQNLTVSVNERMSPLMKIGSSNSHPKTAVVNNLVGQGKDVKSVKDSTDLMSVVSRTNAYPYKEKSIVGHDAYHEKNYVENQKDSKLIKDLSPMEERPSKMVRLNDSSNEENNNHRNIPKSNIIGSSEIKKSSKLVTLSEEKTKSRLPKTYGLDKGSPKEYHHKNMSKLPYGNSSKLLNATHKGNDGSFGQTFKVTRRPVAEKSTWFKELPWEERMKSARDAGTLVLLQNLDPEITSGEVEDIIWHAFNENCSARMVQHTAISTPHYGQAFTIFKTMEAAERVVKKLDDYCLMLPNKRPLVGRIAVLTTLSEKQTTFAGHLTIEKVRRQMQRDMKDAVSTSHYSQTNTIEYEMAMSWCLLQSKSDRWWDILYERQKVRLKKLMDDLKSK